MRQEDSQDYLVRSISKQKVKMGVVFTAKYLPPDKGGGGGEAVIPHGKNRKIEDCFPVV